MVQMRSLKRNIGDWYSTWNVRRGSVNLRINILTENDVMQFRLGIQVHKIIHSRLKRKKKKLKTRLIFNRKLMLNVIYLCKCLQRSVTCLFGDFFFFSPCFSSQMCGSVILIHFDHLTPSPCSHSPNAGKTVVQASGLNLNLFRL